MAILPLPEPFFLPDVNVVTAEPGFENTILPYVELFDFHFTNPGTLGIRAVTTNIIDFDFTWDIDTATVIKISFLAGDTGELISPKFSASVNENFYGENVSLLPFSDTLLSATIQLPPTVVNPITGIRPEPQAQILIGSVNPGATVSISQDLQMRFSFGGGDFIDCKKMVLSTSRDINDGKLIITEQGNSQWEQYGKIVVPHVSVENVNFLDLLYADPGDVKVVLAPGVKNNNPGFISPEGSLALPFVGGIFKIFNPVDVVSANTRAQFLPYIYIPIVGDDLSSLPISMDLQAGTLTKTAETIIQKAAGILGLPYLAHYVEDSSELYTTLIADVVNPDNSGLNPVPNQNVVDNQNQIIELLNTISSNVAANSVLAEQGAGISFSSDENGNPPSAQTVALAVNVLVTSMNQTINSLSTLVTLLQEAAELNSVIISILQKMIAGMTSLIGQFTAANALPVSTQGQIDTYDQVMGSLFNNAFGLLDTYPADIISVVNIVHSISVNYSEGLDTDTIESVSEGANAILFGQLFESPLTFISAVMDNDGYFETDQEYFNEYIPSADDNTFTFVDSAVDEMGEVPFDPTIHARIEKGIVVTPDYSNTWNSAYFIGGSTDCDFPQGGQIQDVAVVNTNFSGDPTYTNNIPLLAVWISDIEGGLYAHMGDQRFINCTPQTWGVYDVEIDYVTGDVYIGTGGGVYVCKNFQVGAANVWTRLGDSEGTHQGLQTPVKKIQLNVTNGVAQNNGTFKYSYFNNTTRKAKDGSPYHGVRVYAFTSGSTETQTGVYTWPMDHEDGISFSSGGVNFTNGFVSEKGGYPGWDTVVINPNVTTFAVLDDQYVYYATSSQAGQVIMNNIMPPFNKENSTSYVFNLIGQDDVSQATANSNVSTNALQDMIAVQGYQNTAPNGSLSNPKSYCYLIANGISANIYRIQAGQLGGDTVIPPPVNGVHSPYEVTFHATPPLVTPAISDSNGGLPVVINMLRFLPTGTMINQTPVQVIACTDQGLFQSPTIIPNFQWAPFNQQSGLDSVNVTFVGVGSTFTDTYTYGLSGYTADWSLTPMFCGNTNAFYESFSGGTWWTERLNDKVTLASLFFDLWHERKITDSSGKPILYPPPVPAKKSLSLIDKNDPEPSQLVKDIFTKYSNYPRSDKDVELTTFKWVRDRDTRGFLYYYLDTGDTSLLKQGQSVSTVSSLSVDDDLIDTTLCSQQLGVVSLKWLCENSVPPFQIDIESSFRRRNSILRFTRPMHIVKCFFRDIRYTEDSVPHIFMDVQGQFYVLKHNIRYGGDSRPYAITTTTLSTEMQKDRLNPTDMAADLQEIVKNLQLRS